MITFAPHLPVHRIFLSMILALSVQSSCTWAEKLDYTWEGFGLHNRRILVLAEANNVLFAGTDNGVFKRNLAEDIEWMPSGLVGKHIGALAISPSNPSVMFAGWSVDREKSVVPSPEADTLFKSLDGGNSWTAICPAMRNHPISNIAAHPADNLIWYASSYARLYQSKDGGTSWTLRLGVEQSSSGIIHSIACDPSHPDYLYVAGESGILTPFFLRSPAVDYELWHDLLKNFAGENGVYSIAIDPRDPRVIMAGMETYIYRSFDSGAHFELIKQPKMIYPRILVMDPREPRRLFLGGVGTAGGQTFNLFWSPDRGDTFQTIPDIMNAAYPTCLILRQSDPSIAYIGTNGTGVFKLTTQIKAATEAPWQSYP